MTDDVLVTGGAGFIGSHLVTRLAADGRRVRVLDRQPPRRAIESVDWIEADVRDAGAVAGAARGASQVFHLASVVGVDSLLADPIEAIDTAVTGTLHVLDAARRSGASVVHLSTSEVLGVNPAVPWREDAERVLGPTTSDRWSYATAKATAEHLVLRWAASGGNPATIVRPFNVYGPGQRDHFVIGAMVAAAVAERPVLVDGDGSQTRCFTYVDDLVEGLVRVAAEPGRVPVIHLGSQDERTILEVAKLILELVGTDGPLEFRTSWERWDRDVPDVPRRVPDTTLARQVFGWSADTPLTEGLAEVVSWVRQATTAAQA
jgi:UDP-glucose 4-epimerase